MEKLEYMQQERQATGLREFLTVVFKHKKKIVTIFLAIAATVTVVSLLLTPVYEAKSTLLVKIGREYVNREVGNGDKAPPVWTLSQEEVANSEIQILTNRDLIEKVITTLKLENVYPDLLKKPEKGTNPMEAAIRRFGKDLDAQPIKKSNVLQVTFQHSDPRIAASAVNLLVENFKEKHLQVFSDPKSGFLDMQRAAYEQKLKESEVTLAAFKQKSGVFSLEEQRTLLLKQRIDLDSALKTSQNMIEELHRRIATLKQQIQAINDTKTYYTHTERDAILVQAQAKLLELQLNEQELLKKYTQDNRLVVKARKEIQLTNDFIKKQETDINKTVKTGNLVYQDAEMQLIKAETELNAQKGKSAALKQQVAQVDGEIRGLDGSERMNQQLKRDHTINEKNYQTYVEKTEEARITDDMNRLKMANISVIQQATAPVEPVKPKTTLNIALGIMLGLVSAFGAAFLSESASQGFSSPDKIEKRIGVPVLATISVKEG